MDVVEVGGSYVSVYLGGGDGGVSEEFLDTADVGAVGE